MATARRWPAPISFSGTCAPTTAASTRSTKSWSSGNPRAGGVVEYSVMLSARDLWIDEKARRAGYENGAALASSHSLKGYRIDQLYRAATRELVDDLTAITTLPKELRTALAAEGFALDS